MAGHLKKEIRRVGNTLGSPIQSESSPPLPGMLSIFGRGHSGGVGGALMKGLLVRVAADQSERGGSWNGPVDSRSREFVYVAIAEFSQTHRGLNKPYTPVGAALGALGSTLPWHLATTDMHLDPDFENLTYGDQGE